MQQTLLKSSKGFTIIEMAIVIAVFLFIIGAGMGIFISIIQNQKRVLAEEQFVNQVSYLEEYVSKALRMAKTEKTEGCLIPGYIYLLTRYDAGTGLFNGIKFINGSDNNTCEEIFLSNEGVLKTLKNPIKSDDSEAIALTPQDLQIKSVKFSINGSDGSASPSHGFYCIPPQACGAKAPTVAELGVVQPRATMLLSILIPGSGSGSITCSSDIDCPSNQACDLSTHKCATPRTIQTTISRRNLNIAQ